MIPILFSSKATNFAGRGIGLLADAISCTVIEERNGAFELTMVYPVDGLHYADITERSIIMAIPSPYRDAQPFRAYSMEQPINGVVTIKARHLCYDMTGIPVEPFTITGGIADIMDEIDNNASLNTGFGLQTDLLVGMQQSRYPLDNNDMSGDPCIFRQLAVTVPVQLVLQTMSRDAGAFAGFGAWYSCAFRYELRGGFNNVLTDRTVGTLNHNQWGLGFTVGVRSRHLTLGYTARFQMNDLLYGGDAPRKARTRSRYFTLSYLF